MVVEMEIISLLGDIVKVTPQNENKLRGRLTSINAAYTFMYIPQGRVFVSATAARGDIGARNVPITFSPLGRA